MNLVKAGNSQVIEKTISIKEKEGGEEENESRCHLERGWE